VIKKPRGRGSHSPCWAAEPEKIIIIIIIIIEGVFVRLRVDFDVGHYVCMLA
jgi:hypothetical protein